MDYCRANFTFCDTINTNCTHDSKDNGTHFNPLGKMHERSEQGGGGGARFRPTFCPHVYLKIFKKTKFDNGTFDGV
jgi:hypothetical protein